jgi:hypothetical protein
VVLGSGVVLSSVPPSLEVLVLHGGRHGVRGLVEPFAVLRQTADDSISPASHACHARSSVKRRTPTRVVIAHRMPVEIGRKSGIGANERRRNCTVARSH